MFLGQFIPWDGYVNAERAKDHGFQFSEHPVEGCGFNYENLDNLQTGIHDYFKYLKFGFGRATDLACNHIRRGMMTRDEGIEHVKKWDGQYPHTYLHEASLSEILAKIGMTNDEFEDCVRQHTNKFLFAFGNSNVPTPLFEVA